MEEGRCRKRNKGAICDNMELQSRANTHSVLSNMFLVVHVSHDLCRYFCAHIKSFFSLLNSVCSGRFNMLELFGQKSLGDTRVFPFRRSLQIKTVLLLPRTEFQSISSSNATTFTCTSTSHETLLIFVSSPRCLCPEVRSRLKLPTRYVLLSCRRFGSTM